SCSIRKGRREGAACGTRNSPPARSPSSRFPAEALSNAAPRASSGSRPSEASKSSAEAPAVRRNGRECRVKAISVRQATKMMSLWPALVNTLAVLATVAVVSTGGTRWAPAAFLVPLVIILWRQRRTVLRVPRGLGVRLCHDCARCRAHGALCQRSRRPLRVELSGSTGSKPRRFPVRLDLHPQPGGAPGPRPHRSGRDAVACRGRCGLDRLDRACASCLCGYCPTYPSPAPLPGESATAPRGGGPGLLPVLARPTSFRFPGHDVVAVPRAPRSALCAGGADHTELQTARLRHGS